MFKNTKTRIAKGLNYIAKNKTILISKFFLILSKSTLILFVFFTVIMVSIFNKRNSVNKRVFNKIENSKAKSYIIIDSLNKRR